MNKGIIKKLVASKGFGFLTVEGEKKDLFFHASGMKNKGDFELLSEGQEVWFDKIENTSKGNYAYGIELS